MNYEEFRTERTRLISEMFDNVDEYGIYPTTVFFEGLDKIFLEQNQQIKELKEVNELMVKDLIDIGYSENHYLIVKAKQALK